MYNTKKNNFINYLMNSSLSLMSKSTMVSNMSLRYLESFAINSPLKTRLKWCITWQKNNFMNYSMNSSLSLISTSTMVSTMSLRYLKSFVIHSMSKKTRSKWCITWPKSISSTSWWTSPSHVLQLVPKPYTPGEFYRKKLYNYR